MQAETAQTSRLRRVGSEFTITNGMSGKDWIILQDQTGIKNDIEWTAIGENIGTLSSALRFNKMYVSNRGGIFNTKSKFFSIEPRFPDFVPEEFTDFVDDRFQEDTSLNYAQLLYTRFTDAGTIISESVRNALDIPCNDLNKTFQICMDKGRGNTYYYQAYCVASASRMPGIFMSDRETSLNTDLLMSIPSYLSFFEDLESSLIQTYNYTKIMVKTKNPDRRVDIKNQIEANEMKYKHNTFYYPDFVKRFESTNSIMSLMFIILTVLALSLALFSLISTMAANIVEQSKELAIMRCIGLNRFSISRIFLYESLIVILTGGFIGLVIGTAIGWTILAQNALFSNNVLVVRFPWGILVTVLIFSFISSILAAAIPVFIFLKQNIVKLIKIIQ